MRHILSLSFLFISSLFLGADLYKLDLSSFNSSSWVQSDDNDYTISGTNNQVSVNYTKTDGFSNFSHTFTAIDISQSPLLTLTISSTEQIDLRIDLSDNVGRLTNATPVSKVVNDNGDVTLTYDFTGLFNQIWPNSSTVDDTQISEIAFLINPGIGNSSATFQIKSITLGNPSGTEVPQPSIDVKGAQFLINQVGYERLGPKKALIQTTESLNKTGLYAYVEDNNDVKLDSFLIEEKGAVTGWTGRYFYEVDFSSFGTNGTYHLSFENVNSYDFEVAEGVLFDQTASKVITFFNEIRNTDTQDHNLPFYDTPGKTADVYGGWSDASGDPGKHMSHLTYSNFFDPQQIPLVAYSLIQAKEWNTNEISSTLADDWDNEIDWGIDYLMRQYDQDGYFYLAIFDDWGGSTTREVCEWGQPGQNNARTANYQCAMREGAGIAIASLAKAYRLNRNVINNGLTGGNWTPQNLLQTAESAYAHLKSTGNGYASKNLEYCNDHEENIIDEYCGLLAAIELFESTQNNSYLIDARAYATRLMDKMDPNTIFASNSAKTRPFFHASDEGMPVFALYKLAKIDHESQTSIKTFTSNWISYYTTISNDVNNPFNYVRERVAPYENDALGTVKNSFFVPHDNETGYWWQGENARLASMSCAMLIASNINSENFDILSDNSASVAVQPLNWILGSNPFDLCMMTGVGTTTYPEYLEGSKGPNHEGGICNGISAGNVDESDIDFMPYDISDWQNWRWIEQWLPHDAWYLMAVSYYNHLAQNKLDCNLDLDGLAITDSCNICAVGRTGIIYNSDPNNCPIVGIENFYHEEIVIQNPVSDLLTINGTSSSFAYRIFDINGQLITSKNESFSSIETGSLLKGTYILELIDKENVTRLKFIKE